jgi:hypothetical protein
VEKIKKSELTLLIQVMLAKILLMHHHLEKIMGSMIDLDTMVLLQGTDGMGRQGTHMMREEGMILTVVIQEMDIVIQRVLEGNMMITDARRAKEECQGHQGESMIASLTETEGVKTIHLPETTIVDDQDHQTTWHLCRELFRFLI